MKKNSSTLILLLFCIIIFYQNNNPTDITFNQNLIFNGNVTVINDVVVNGPISLLHPNANTTISGDFILENNTPSTVIFDNTSKLNAQSINYFTEVNPMYLLLDNSTKQLYCTDILRKNLTLNTLSVNNIISNINTDLILGSENQNITIGNGNNTIIFEKKLIANNTMTSNNDTITINGRVNFTGNLKANNILLTNNDININPIDSESPIIISCENFTINEPLEYYNFCTLGNNNLLNTININGYIFTQNITIGLENNPLLTIIGLPIINNPASYLISNTDNTVSKINNFNSFPTVILNEFNTNAMNINNISALDGEINLTSPQINILANNVIIFNRVGPPYNITSKILTSDSPIIFTGTVINEQRYPIPIYTNRINASPSKTVEILNFFQNENSGYKINEMIFNFEHYFFKNLITDSPILGYLSLDLSNNNLVYNNLSLNNNNSIADISNINPVSYTYNNLYNIKNNDICKKNKKKIVHFGFIAEELEKLNIPKLIKYDVNHNIYDYETTILWLILKEKIIHYQNYLKLTDVFLGQLQELNNKILIDIEKIEKKINFKKKIYQKIKKYANQLNIKGL